MVGPADGGADAAATVAEVRHTDVPREAFFGDTHVHTGWSADAGMDGAVTGPEDAYRLAIGEEVKSNTGQKTKLHRPFDWFMVTDHSDGMGTINEIVAGNAEMMAEKQLAGWRDALASGDEARAGAAKSELIVMQSTGKLPAVMMDPKWMKSAWEKTVKAAEDYNKPGKFTTFIAYEWTVNADGGDNLHRNVIFRDGADRTLTRLPLTTFETQDSTKLWEWMAAYEKDTGGQVLAIPHNGNMSNGRMFEEKQFDGSPMTREWAEMRSRYEPLYEVTQIKGQSESHPTLSPADEFAELGSLGPRQPDPEAQAQGRSEVRVLARGAEVGPADRGRPRGQPVHVRRERRDRHAYGALDDRGRQLLRQVQDPRAARQALGIPDPERADRRVHRLGAGGFRRHGRLGDGQHARGDLGRDEAQGDLRDDGTADQRAVLRRLRLLRRRPREGFRRGRLCERHPDGWGTEGRAAGKAPAFLVAATKDPQGANLDRVQVVKGWVDAGGKTHEKVFDVKWSGDRKPDAKGKLPPVGDTVDRSKATYANTIGAPEFIALFRDPEFDASQRAFYYVRVLEIPTPRWTLHDQVRFNEPMPKKVPLVHQERAFSSPIWYTP